MFPQQPQNPFPSIFGHSGDTIVVAEIKPASGRASFSEGFPTETQQPLREGGIAPNRLDFNGLFNMVTAFGHWGQSGGHYSYNQNLGYSIPCIVFHGSKMWWCVRDNGPESNPGEADAGIIVEPGTSETYWKEYLKVLIEASPDLVEDKTPVGALLWSYSPAGWSERRPDGYFPCTGYQYDPLAFPKLYSKISSVYTPDFRGYFLRCLDDRPAPAAGGTDTRVDPDAPRTGGSIQTDAFQNHTGSFYAYSNLGGDGALFTPRNNLRGGIDNDGSGYKNLDFNPSNIPGVRTATETRGINVALPVYIKHD